ncbi:hypothetical protein L6452_12307 [Arctium lappa]|uniref:Uncharacterized protein n=1 Tax=Arctium lappa TaxID=4217 RepID=A0ACB9DRE8_ARCLA|nr:hypothetical protein L6452_12307 [Arctium lappa]
MLDFIAPSQLKLRQMHRGISIFRFVQHTTLVISIGILEHDDQDLFDNYQSIYVVWVGLLETRKVDERKLEVAEICVLVDLC